MFIQLRFSPDAPGPAPRQPKEKRAIFSEENQGELTGDNLQGIPDAVEIEHKGEEGPDLDPGETWRRAGGGEPLKKK